MLPESKLRVSVADLIRTALCPFNIPTALVDLVVSAVGGKVIHLVNDAADFVVDQLVQMFDPNRLTPAEWAEVRRQRAERAERYK